MKVSLVFAADDNNGIGKGNGLPWPKMSADLRRFKQITLGHYVIMGRTTHESMGGELLGRKNIVISRRDSFELPPSIEFVQSLGEALHIAQTHGEQEAMVIGGAMLFQEAVLVADTFYLTRIHGVFDADTFLPDLDMNAWQITEQQDFEADEKNPFPYSFLRLEKKEL